MFLQKSAVSTKCIGKSIILTLPEGVADLYLSVINNGYINGIELVIDGGHSYK